MKKYSFKFLASLLLIVCISLSLTACSGSFNESNSDANTAETAKSEVESESTGEESDSDSNKVVVEESDAESDETAAFNLITAIEIDDNTTDYQTYEYSYNSEGAIVKKIYTITVSGNKTETVYEYDSTGRISSETVTSEGTDEDVSIQETIYDYDGNVGSFESEDLKTTIIYDDGKLLSKTNISDQDGNSLEIKTTYLYDENDNLLSETTTSNLYDEVGNLLSDSSNPTAMAGWTQVYEYTYDDSGRIISKSYEYDSLGINMYYEYTYDDESGRLKTASTYTNADGG